ncbi:MAG: hypothetical protein J5876_01745 [Lachnospiraceae bacterium]|nr:hypothetical protein [Lachnospiraceae bacterium]MBO4462307.1 hypothetical protein [Lachnospiraceae bacterium]MBR4795949.1 hypothetical protein [Lachnospiraceae bacterium]
MKKISITLIISLILVLLVGCGSGIKTDESAISVKKNGKITGVSIEAFDKSYYSEEELSDFVEKTIKEYQQENGDSSVKLESLKVEEGKATLYINYETPTDYAKFNGEELFVGTILDAMAAGYNLDTTYYEVSGTTLGTATSIDLIDDDYKVVIVKEKIRVIVPGKIKFVSDNLTIIDKNTVTPTNKNATGYSIIIYK